ncbi:MAG: trypsin-like peptidase domain-containing protein [Planctomycetota bacterium]|jgi:tetratricopeptide (TPR) repeat protein
MNTALGSLALRLALLGAVTLAGSCGGEEKPAAAPERAAEPAARTLSVTDLVELKRLGFSDDQIRAEVTQTGSRFRLSAADVAQLEQAGFGAAAIAFLEQSARVPLDLEAVVAMVEAGESAARILERIEASGQTFELTPAQALDLARKRAPAAVIFALKGRPLTAEDLKQLAAAGVAPATWTRLVGLLKVAPVPLPPAEALALVRSGVPREIVAMLRQPGDAPAPEPTPPPAEATPAPEPTPPPAEPAPVAEPTPPPAEATPAAEPTPAPVPEAEPAPEPTPAAAEPWDGLAVVTPPHEPGVYRHVGRRFVIRFPEAWAVVRALDHGEINYFFTPEKGQTNPHACKVTLQLQQYPTPEASTMQGKDAASILRHMLPMFKQWEPGLTPTGEVAAARLGRLEAAKTRLSGSLKATPGDFTIEVHIAEDRGRTYLAVTQAPRRKYDRWADTFRKILAESTFGRTPPERREQSLEARHIVKRYKASTVSITALTEGKGGTGTGFIVSPEGYVITNHHVVWNHEAKKPHTEFWVEWDDSLKRKKVPAKLLGFRYALSVYQLQHGTDIALLKIPAGDHEPWPLTPLSAVEAGDRVVTLGFPSRGLLAGVSITITTGVVTRFNRGPNGAVETIFTDAAITHGSSGGPCVSLVTGGVIGLNTFGQDVRVQEGERQLNDLLNYFGVVPIDTCLKEFPLVTELGVAYEADGLDFFDSFGLARHYAQAGSYGAAERLAARTVALKPQEADAHWLLAFCKYERAWSQVKEAGLEPFKQKLPAIVKAFQYALDLEPKHHSSLSMLAQLHVDLDKAAEAVPFADRAIEAEPDNWEGYFVRARCALARKQYAEAVRYANKSKELTGRTFVHPYVMAGMAHYANGLLDAGRAEYTEAVRIHPADLQSRLGVARYHDLKKETDAAVAAYRRILEDFPDNPVVYWRIGNSFYEAKRYKDAVQNLSSSYQQYRRLGETPPEDLFWVLGDALRQEKQMDMAAHVFATALSYHSASPNADKLHIQLANLHIAAKQQGLSSAHLRAVHALTRDADLRGQVEKIRLSPLSLDEIKRMLSLEYPLSVAYPLVLNSPVNFAVRTEQEVQQLQQQHRLPPPIIHAILKSQEKHGAQGGQPGRQPGQPPGRRPEVRPAAGMVGTWLAQGRTNDGQVFALVLQLTRDGKYASQTYVNNQLVETEQGIYRATRTHITSQSNAGETETYRYRLQGDSLALALPGGDQLVFERRRERGG